MNRNFGKGVAIGSGLSLIALLAGCTTAFNSVRTGPLRTETQTVEAKGATSAHVDVVMGFGELMMGSEASDLAQANFT
ncbi:MAG: hypothetical protein HC853_07745 [Anaerolineae bacterium]|nr:hypothetical protein [Anaerolineae bacterium]